MTDLDIQIDDPDDDEPDAAVRVLSGGIIPPWLKVAGLIVLGGMVALIAGAFLLGRIRTDEEPLITPTVATTPLASAEASPAIEHALDAVDAWERFAREGDLGIVAGTFDEDGPQFAMFEDSPPDPDGPTSVDFTARNLSEQRDQETTTVSMDLVVVTDGLAQTYPYDFVYLDDSDLVWTVIDRRAPGTTALPPPADAIAGAQASWETFTAAMSIGDGRGALDVVSADSQILADQVASAAAGQVVDQPLIDDPELFDLLVARVERAAAADSGEAMIAMLDPDQRQTLVIGDLTSWTQVDENQLIATLELSGQEVATVPFLATAEGWTFDLRQALASSGGANQ